MSTTELMPFAKKMGLEIIERTADRALARIEIKRELCNRSGVASGGLIMALADALGTELTMAALPPGVDAMTNDSNTNFVAPIPEGQTAVLECNLIHSEKQRIVWETRITRADGHLAAVVRQTLLIGFVEDEE